MDRWARLREIERLDSERDHARIYHLFMGWEFPWDVHRALELALLRTFCVPSIAALLDRTGEFHARPQKRYDDTALLIATFCEHGYQTGLGAAAIARMNAIHARFQIANDDFLYVLSTFVLEPIRWVDAFGWRPTCVNERVAAFAFWREVGARMDIRDIPGRYDALEHWSRDFERRRFKRTEASVRVGRATRALFASWLPAALRALGDRALSAIADSPMRAALDLPAISDAETQLVRGLLRARGQAERRLPGRNKSAFITEETPRSYPHGYRIEELGPTSPGAPPPR